MIPMCCERCESPGAVRVAGRVALCEGCIRRALDARFPVFGLPLPELELALSSLTGARPLRQVGR